MNEYNSRAFRWMLGLLFGENDKKKRKNVYEDQILRKIGQISPETLERVEKMERSKYGLVTEGGHSI